ncbi:MAG: hypothetical protein Q8T11_14650 [Elusimicrobiota bacterium]|nr:hypothetical protein [Elusimicrobiota bacterium]
MKRSILAVAVLLLTAVNASAYSHSFKNNGNATVRFWVNYKACSNDTWEAVKPGETITWRSGLCCISQVVVQHVGSDYAARTDGVPRGEASALGDDILKPAFLNDIICRNTNWSYAGGHPIRL